MGKTSLEPMEIGSAFNNRFLMAVAIAKRAKQLKEGVKPLVAYNREFEILPIEVALEEVHTGKVAILVKDSADTHHDFLDEMDQLLASELEEAVVVEDDKKPAPKEKVKMKKSLAA